MLAMDRRIKSTYSGFTLSEEGQGKASPSAHARCCRGALQAGRHGSYLTDFERCWAKSRRVLWATVMPLLQARR
jgi:hypothetical protein